MQETSITIRTLEPADWNEVCRVYELAAVQELARAGVNPSAFRPMPDEEDRDTFFKSTSLAACVGGRIVGFVAWRDGGYISWLYVDPAYQRRGIGTRLLSEAMNRIGPEAWTLAKSGNDSAVRLYQEHGMEIVKSQPRETWGYPHTELRLALPTSRKHDPAVPSFGG